MGAVLLIFVKFLIQIIVVSGIIYFVSGRLIGSSINFVRRVLSVVISVTLTSFVYWYSYLRHTDFFIGINGANYNRGKYAHLDRQYAPNIHATLPRV